MQAAYLRLSVDFFGTQPFIVYNDRGLLVASGTLSPGALLSIQSLPSGLYVIDLPRVKRYVRVVKK